MKKSSKALILISGSLIGLFLYGYGLNFPHQVYFDETYYVQSARELLTMNINSWAGVHSPMGTGLIALGIWVFGDFSWAWRIMPFLAAWGLIIVFLILVYKLTTNFWISVSAAFLLVVEGINLTHARMANPISLMMLWMFLTLLTVLPFLKGSENSRKRLFVISGVFLSFAIITRWVGLGIVAVISIYLIKVFLKEKNKSAFLRDILMFYVLVPLGIYLLFHISLPVAKGTVWANVWDRHKFVLNWHLTLTEGHPYHSEWWGWPILIRPVWFFFKQKEGLVNGIICIGNPAIYWMIPFALLYVLFKYIKNRQFVYGLTLAGFFTQWLPWAWIGNLTFFYYFYTAVPFSILAICLLAQRVWKIEKIGKWFVIWYFLVVMLMFFYWYPLYTGMPISESYFRDHMWFRSWV
jgi:dolichyl-phosphate-mannose--protein O-mannosyl transferase